MEIDDFGPLCGQECFDRHLVKPLDPVELTALLESMSAVRGLIAPTHGAKIGP